MLYNFKAGTFTSLAVNEDAYGYSDSCAWVLDGSTGLSGRNLISGNGSSDARWYAEELSRYLGAHLQDVSKPIPDILSDAVSHCRDEFLQKLGDTEYTRLDVPCTLGVAVRLNCGVLEYAAVGDCRIIVRKTDGGVSEIYDETLCKLDENTLNAGIEASKKYGLPLIKCREYMQEQLEAVRLSVNRPDGYIAMTDDPDAVLGALNGSIPAGEICDVCLVSDGFSQYYDLFGLEPNSADFIEKVSYSDPENMYKELFAAQSNDASCDKYPRFKLSDDATIVYFKLS